MVRSTQKRYENSNSRSQRPWTVHRLPEQRTNWLSAAGYGTCRSSVLDLKERAASRGAEWLHNRQDEWRGGRVWAREHSIRSSFNRDGRRRGITFWFLSLLSPTYHVEEYRLLTLLIQRRP